MRIVCDVEGNGLEPTEIWVVVCKDIDNNSVSIFRNITSNQTEKERFLTYAKDVSVWIGHHWLGYDYPVLRKLAGLEVHDVVSRSVDTLVVSKLVDYSRKGGHSIEQYGKEFGTEKLLFQDWSCYSKQLEERCVQDVEICEKIFNLYLPVISSKSWSDAIALESEFQSVANELHGNGFYFRSSVATALLSRVVTQLEELDREIVKAFPPKQVKIKEFTPRETKHGTISKTSVPRSLWPTLHEYEVGKTYPVFVNKHFNPSSPKQIVEVLADAGWSPTDKTKTHIDTERQLNRARLLKSKADDLDLSSLRAKMCMLERYGWKINENNLSTLPPSAPSPARTLAKRILVESRRRTLTEQLALVREDGRIHGEFFGIGAWTHRMAHQKPNTANIPNEYDLNKNKKYLGKEMRALWGTPKGRLLVGVDAEGIQLRIFAHYINDPEFTRALVEGRKEDGSDPHSLNQRVLGPICKSRDAAKRFIYAFLLGAGLGKLAEILEVSRDEAQTALDRLMERYKGFTNFKKNIIPNDARRGFFSGLDGRCVKIPGEDAGARAHLAMSGYLQNGEAVVMKKATLLWREQLKEIKDSWKLVNLVHDEWQVECVNNMDVALKIASTMSNSLTIVGQQLKLRCPLAGSYWNEGAKDYTIGTNWSVTH